MNLGKVMMSKAGEIVRVDWKDGGYVFYTYDDDGNLTQDGRWNYTWDADEKFSPKRRTIGWATLRYGDKRGKNARVLAKSQKMM